MAWDNFAFDSPTPIPARLMPANVRLSNIRTSSRSSRVPDYNALAMSRAILWRRPPWPS